MAMKSCEKSLSASNETMGFDKVDLESKCVKKSKKGEKMTDNTHTPNTDSLKAVRGVGVYHID